MGLKTLTDVQVLDRQGRGRWMRAEIDSDVLDIRRRLVEGDATCGWRGDPTARLFAEGPFIDPVTHKELWTWIVRCTDRAGVEYTAASIMAPTADHRIIEKMVAGDWQHGGKLIDTLMSVNDEVERDRQREMVDFTEEWADKFHYAMRRDIGHLEGGTRRMTSLAGVFKEDDDGSR